MTTSNIRTKKKALFKPNTVVHIHQSISSVQLCLVQQPFCEINSRVTENPLRRNPHNPNIGIQIIPLKTRRRRKKRYSYNFSLTRFGPDKHQYFYLIKCFNVSQIKFQSEPNYRLLPQKFILNKKKSTERTSIFSELIRVSGVNYYR